MKFVVAGYGSRGDVEPCIAVARELLRRGHDVRMAVTVPPDMLAFVESAGLTVVPYGRDYQELLGDKDFVPMLQNPIKRDLRSYRICCPGFGGEEHDADLIDRRGRPARGGHNRANAGRQCR
jgi:UDP:flavonoid glycosyltransferase YjiC (YdhE family)